MLKIVRRGVLYAAALMAVTSGTTCAIAEERIALVIGNGAYQVPSWRLKNPANDARAIADRLERLGFEDPILEIDATRDDLEDAMREFGRRLKAAGDDAVSFVFYAGHGVQHDGVNYLVPTDSDAYTSDELRYGSPPLSFLLNDMRDAGNAVNILVLDACRDMPLPEGERSVGRGGLAEIGQAPSVFIGFATAPNRTARDGDGDNSPYTAALLEALDHATHEPLALLFDDVSIAVRRATGGGQQPQYRNGLGVSRWALSDEPLEQPELSMLDKALAGNDRGLGRPRPHGDVFRDCDACPEMVAIQGGAFTMGSPADEPGRDDNEGPQRDVDIAPFAIGRFEVTFDEWDACVADGGCAVAPGDEGWGRGRRPVIRVSWNDAQDYVTWLNSQISDAAPYRLPSEAEWEYAARAGTTGRFSNDGDEAGLCAIANHSDQASGLFRQKACDDGAIGKSAPVGSYAENPWELFDMHGNVSEWVQDCWSRSYEGAPVDGSAWMTGDCAQAVQRGGSWVSDAENLRSANRAAGDRRDRFSGVGFRVARSFER